MGGLAGAREQQPHGCDDRLVDKFLPQYASDRRSSSATRDSETRQHGDDDVLAGIIDFYS